MGIEKKEFFINRELICSVSEFFKTACKPEWTSGSENRVILESENSAIFSIFLSWLLTDDIHSAEDLILCPSKDEEAFDESTTGKLLVQSCRQLLRCFVFADYIQCHRLQNAIMESILRLIRQALHEHHVLLITLPENVQIVYAKTSKTSPLRRLILD